MSENAVPDYSNTCAKLADAIRDLSVRLQVSKQNKKLRDNYQENIIKLDTNIKLCTEVINVLKPMLDDIQSYITERRKNSMQNINNALRLAGEIIPDSMDGIHFELDGDDAWLSTIGGLEVDMVEGGGYRQISSAFVRSVVLGSNTDTLDTVFLDEVFSMVSPENSNTLSLYLNIICKDMQVISIEQKPEVYSNIDCTVYNFYKIGKYATVTKTVVDKRGV